MRIIPPPNVPDERPTAVHASPCKHCPSAHYPPDPESLDMLNYSPEEKRETLFTCGWRPGKLCKGWCDFIGVYPETAD